MVQSYIHFGSWDFLQAEPRDPQLWVVSGWLWCWDAQTAGAARKEKATTCPLHCQWHLRYLPTHIPGQPWSAGQRKKQGAPPATLQARAGPGWCFLGKIIICIKKEPLIGETHLVRTSSQEGTDPTWPSTKGLHWSLSVFGVYKLSSSKFSVSCFLVVITFNLHMPVSFCVTRVIRRPKKENSGRDIRVQEENRDIFQFSVALVPVPTFLPLCLQKAWGRILVRSAYTQRFFTSKTEVSAFPRQSNVTSLWIALAIPFLLYVLEPQPWLQHQHPLMNLLSPGHLT